jgi:hypothetical protein
MAVVWRGYDPRLEREVAIKEPVVEPGTDEATRADLGARFVREGRAAAKLNHPGIVTIHAADVFDGRPAIVMELIEGETLADILSGGRLPAQSVRAVLDQLLDAVAYAHDRGIVHRDIKPDNVFITHDGRVKLADFGIAHVADSATLKTQAGTVMGTPGYMAPEQITGGPVDARTDIFAIGAIAYEMVVGVNPFGATDGVAATTIMYRIVHEQPVAPPDYDLRELPAGTWPVIAVALAKDPAQRFPDARAFREALRTGSVAAGLAASEAPASAQWTPGPPVVVDAQGSRAWLPYAILGGFAVLALLAMILFSGAPSVGIQPIVSVPSAPSGSAPAAARAQATPVGSEKEVTDALNRWAETINNGDLQAHLDTYAPTVSPWFDFARAGRSDIETRMRVPYETYTSMEMNLSGVTVTFDNPETAFADFYKSWVFTGAATKTGSEHDRIGFRKINGKWLITSETAIP